MILMILVLLVAGIVVGIVNEFSEQRRLGGMADETRRRGM